MLIFCVSTEACLPPPDCELHEDAELVLSFLPLYSVTTQFLARSRPTVPVFSGFCGAAGPRCVLGGLGTPAHLGTGLFFKTSPSEQEVEEEGGPPCGCPGPARGPSLG